MSSSDLDPSALAGEFHTRVATQSPAKVVAWCRELSDLGRSSLTLHVQGEALAALGEDTVDSAALDGWAVRLEILADAHEDDPRRAAHLRGLGAKLRNATEWRAQQRAEWERTKPTPRLMEATAVAQNCWRDEPVPVRLQRIEQAQRRLGELVKEAEADGEWGEVAAISEYATSVWRLRQALAPSPGEKGS